LLQAGLWDRLSWSHAIWNFSAFGHRRSSRHPEVTRPLSGLWVLLRMAEKMIRGLRAAWDLQQVAAGLLEKNNWE